MSELAAERLAFGYRGHPVGSGVDLAIASGEIVCLLGPNGCGKTTLFKTLLGLLPAQGGRVLLDGVPIRRMARADIARRVAYVPQAHDAVFPFTVHDMVLMGRTAHRRMFAVPGDADRRRAGEALAQLGIADLAARDYTRISGGQRQLVLVARALAQDASMVIMDEPTASLDFGNQAQVLERVVQLADSGLGIIISTHDPDHAFAFASRVLVLHEGAVIADGPPVDILTSERLELIYGVGVEIERLENGRRVCVPRLAARGPGLTR